MNRPPTLLRTLVLLIAAHSWGVGLCLVLFPGPITRFAGWVDVQPLFFPVQAGVFHLVLATGYVMEYFRLRTIHLLLVAKATAFLFLTLATLIADVPWVIPFSGLADGFMGLAAWYVFKRSSSPLSSS